MSFKLYYEIKERLTKIDKGVVELCNKAGVNRSILHQWSVQKPKTFEIADKLEATLAQMEADHAGKNADKQKA